MNVRLVAITPKLARQWLEKNNNVRVNRNISQSLVDKYAKEMAGGYWELNGEAIKLDVQGNLVDGQHRLSAIVKANVTVNSLVVFDIPMSISVMDRGRMRSVEDILQMEGMDKALATRTNVAITRLVFFKEKTHTNISDTEIRNFIFEYSEIFKEIAEVSSHRRKRDINPKHASLLTATFYAFLNREDKETISKFYECFASGFYETPEQTPAIILRNDILTNRIDSKGGNPKRIQYLYAAERAIKDFCNKKERTQSYSVITKKTYSMKEIENESII